MTHQRGARASRLQTAWSVLEDALDRLYPDEPFYGFGIRADDLRAMFERLGADPTQFGPEWDYPERDEVKPLEAIRVFEHTAEPRHWHYVTMGFSDLYGRESGRDGYSGYGFEFTMRVAAIPGEEAPPYWPVAILSKLASYVFQTGNVFQAGHHLDADGPVLNIDGVNIEAFAVFPDPEMEALQTASGKVDMLQVVGLTRDEYRALQKWTSKGMLGLIGKRDPYFMTDLFRDSILDSAQMNNLVEEGARRDGSSTGAYFIQGLQIKRRAGKQELSIYVDTLETEFLVTGAVGRIPFGKPLKLIGKECQLILEPSNKAGWRMSDLDDTVLLSVSSTLSSEIEKTIRPMTGIYSWPCLEGVKIIVRDRRSAS